MTGRESISSYRSLGGSPQVTNIKEYFQYCKKKFNAEYNKKKAPTVEISRFNILVTLKKGHFGSTKLVQDKKDGNLYAMKVVDKQKVVEDKAVRHVRNERLLLENMDFPLAVSMEFFGMDNSNVYFFMPFYSGGDLRNLLRKRKRFSENLARFYTAQIILALEYLQHILYVHRDIKPGNVLLDCTGYIRLADYGFAKMVEERTFTLCGTPPYIAPEMIEGHGYARSVDWWSLGILVFEMVAGSPPFEAQNNTVLFTKISSKPLDLPSAFSKDLQNLLKKLLQRDVSRRIGNLKHGADDVKEQGWFKKISWLNLLNKRVTPPLIPNRKDSDPLRNFPSANKSSDIKMSPVNLYAEEFKDF